MAIRDWSARRIRGLWIVGVLAELLVIYLVFVAARIEQKRAVRAWADSRPDVSGPTAELRRQEFYRLLQDSFGISVHVAGDTLTTFSKDSFSVAAVTHGDTLRRLDLSPAAERTVNAVTAPIGQALVDMAPEMFLILALYLAVALLPIPLALTITTLVWWRARRRMAYAGIETADEDHLHG
ncbi:hypothetical protein [Longimicrobium terrae]|uniref:Uncharacterized protein n=1 Tax=Longimicrobium terrae TaxID=1639882 RepID=A0A841GRH8_9BACT|nr:hypothetical protein [Longimicrobium terrae]MBB4634241.1 hypothetical protein [Longimicrobium terrae]MBB6068869.1 hypothetical protein [Longimicrobium terrae]NNC28049.1 hypothetical protein [Longimicrobium terrae]